MVGRESSTELQTEGRKRTEIAIKLKNMLEKEPKSYGEYFTLPIVSSLIFLFPILSFS